MATHGGTVPFASTSLAAASSSSAAATPGATAGESEFLETRTSVFEWKLTNLKHIFDSSRGDGKSKCIKSAFYGRGRWQLYFYGNSGHAEQACSLYLSCEPTHAEKERAIQQLVRSNASSAGEMASVPGWLQQHSYKPNNGGAGDKGKRSSSSYDLNKLPWRRDGRFKFTLEIKSLDRQTVYKSMRAEDVFHHFSSHERNWGWSKFWDRADAFYNNAHVKGADAFLVVCTLTQAPEPPLPAPSANRQAVPFELLNAYATLFDDPQYADVVFVIRSSARIKATASSSSTSRSRARLASSEKAPEQAGEKRVYAAKKLLAARSDYFEVMFNSGFVESDTTAPAAATTTTSAHPTTTTATTTGMGVNAEQQDDDVPPGVSLSTSLGGGKAMANEQGDDDDDDDGRASSSILRAEEETFLSDSLSDSLSNSDEMDLDDDDDQDGDDDEDVDERNEQDDDDDDAADENERARDGTSELEGEGEEDESDDGATGYVLDDDDDGDHPRSMSAARRRSQHARRRRRKSSGARVGRDDELERETTDDTATARQDGDEMLTSSSASTSALLRADIAQQEHKKRDSADSLAGGQYVDALANVPPSPPRKRPAKRARMHSRPPHPPSPPKAADAPAHHGRKLTEVIVTDASYTTFRALLYYLYTDYIHFRPLASNYECAKEAHAELSDAPFMSRRAYVDMMTTQRIASLSGGSVVTPTWQQHQAAPCSSKAIYVLADKLGLVELKQRAYDSLIGALTVDNIALEVFGSFSAQFDEIRKVEIEFLLQNWNQVRGSASMKKVFNGLRANKWRGFEDVWMQILGSLEYRPGIPPPPPAETN